MAKSQKSGEGKGAEQGASVLRLSEGKRFVRLARRSIEYFMHTSRLLPETAPNEAYMEKRGVFVTLHEFPSRQLRGCIGFAEPVKPLWEAVIEAAVSAAFHDPRFPPLQASELDSVIVELSILSRPELISVASPLELPSKIEVGVHGLIVEQGYRSGLLLAVVPVEYGWTAEEFIEHTCKKAGLESWAWKDKRTKFYSFESQLFAELSPGGDISELNLAARKKNRQLTK